MPSSAWKNADTDFDTALANERKWQKEAGNTPDFKEGVAAFLEKRAPRFNG